MKLTIPELTIDEKEGFEKQDLFKRKEFGERLACLIENSDDNLVLALDGQWGEGKSTFIKMWQGHVEHQRKNKLKTIYFDAFANDYQKDPFLALASEIYELFTDEEQAKKDAFMEKAGGAMKALARGAIKIGVRAATSGLIDGSVLDSVEKETADLVSGQVDKVIADRFESAAKDKLAIKAFRKYLEELASEIGGDKPLIFIIDELDRCRPDFALELLEQIKHLFSVQGITFLLVLNRGQLENSIKARYGADIEASVYLQKFIKLWVTIPRKFDRSNIDAEAFIKHAFQKIHIDGDNSTTTAYAMDVISELAKSNNSSYREIERTLSFYALIRNMTSSTVNCKYYQQLITLICFIAACKSDVLDQIRCNSIDADGILNACGIPTIESSNKNPTLSKLSKIVHFDFSAMNERKELFELTPNLFQNEIWHEQRCNAVGITHWISDLDNNYYFHIDE